MAAWTTAVNDLRVKLSDGPTDKLRAFKRVFGILNGTNKLFKTFEFRRVTNFTTATTPLGVYKNDVLLLTTDIASDDPATGYFTLVAAPVDGDRLECAYNIQWFLDTELQDFLRIAMNWALGIDDYSTTVEGLRQAVLNYASAEAYQKLALRWIGNLSETYRMEDAPDPKKRDLVQQYMDAAESLRKEAVTLRDDYYTRKGQSKAPLFRTLSGNVPDVAPRR